MRQLKMRPEIARKWVDALRSGKYQQGKHRLGTVKENGDIEYCCLGVLCEVAVAEGVIAPPSVITSSYFEPRGRVSYNQSEATPPEVVCAWAFEDWQTVDYPDIDSPEYKEFVDPNSESTLWTVRDVEGKFNSFPARSGDENSVHLPEVNDAANANFEEIAVMIEATHLEPANV